MHEMALTQSVIDILAEEAKRQSFSHVRRVWLEIGVLSQVDPAAMQFCFEALGRGTVADGATLEIISAEGAAWCMTCSTTVPLTQRSEACPACGGHRLQVTAGEDMRVKELEVE